ncbi:glycosyltransferase [Dyadobacter alkalitolerans]|uniref:glycosyltransferase n=1 Tax=Dyadobacter alkalitolerans TaxID=492736 RepID=UPI000413EA82|nr:glycosyltransferase [Dyadobacter alkalitolerans]
MGKRKHLGLFFKYNENWIGGTYYILNLVQALNVLPDDEKPDISVISLNKTDFHYIKKETGYPYLFHVRDRSTATLWEKAVNAFSLRLLKRKVIDRRLSDRFDLIFPNPAGNYFDLINDQKKAYWIPDFQELHLPDFFHVDELIQIKQRQIAQVYKAKKMVFSSLDAKRDFLTLYPYAKAKIYIVPFSVTHPNIKEIDFEGVAMRYAIDRPYYFIPNQFWIHKNQFIVIEAVKLLVADNEDILVVFSGKENDYRSPEYADQLKRMVREEGLESNVKFLGFIDRKEQLVIMKNAISLIQPSLFEGWSTAIEDAKALNIKIIASELRVHFEQLTGRNDCILFNPHAAPDLAAAMAQIKEINPAPPIDYSLNNVTHARAFCTLFA